LVLDRAKIECFVVGFSTSPAAEDYTDPVKGERSCGAGVGFSFATLAFVKDRWPPRAMDGLAGEFVESLTKEFWAKQAPADPARFAATLDYGSDSTGTFESQWRRASGIDPNPRRIVIAEADSYRRPKDSQIENDRGVVQIM
jgi:hypothetical protein